MQDKIITPKNAKGEPHGYWEVIGPTEDVAYKCYYINGDNLGLDIDIKYKKKLYYAR